MLVDHDAVVAELVGEHDFVEVALVELMPAFGIVIFVREVDPQRRKLFVVFRQMHIGHEMHEVETDAAVSSVSLALAA